MRRGLLVALIALTGSLLAQSKNEPVLPVIDKNACPFECCQFGEWKAVKSVKVFSDWKRQGRKQLFLIKKDETVEALTGVHITYQPGHMKILVDMPELKLRKGQVVSTYMYTGEGFLNFWNAGQMINDQVLGNSCNKTKPKHVFTKYEEPTCMLDDGDKEWWVQIKAKDGRKGWVRGAEAFENADSCA